MEDGKLENINDKRSLIFDLIGPIIKPFFNSNQESDKLQIARAISKSNEKVSRHFWVYIWKKSWNMSSSFI